MTVTGFYGEIYTLSKPWVDTEPQGYIPEGADEPMLIYHITGDTVVTLPENGGAGYDVYVIFSVSSGGGDIEEAVHTFPSGGSFTAGDLNTSSSGRPSDA